MKNSFDLTGRKALVTGGSRGIGAAIVETFARHGAQVALCQYGDDENAERLVQRLSAEGLSVSNISCDVSSQSQVHDMAAWARRELGHVDILLNSAGVGGSDKPFAETTQDDWDRIIGINLQGTFLATHAFFGEMCERKYGRVINIASQLAYKGAAGLAHYCAAKAGVVGFTRALSFEGAPYNVLVNAIAPGPVDTELLRAHSREWLDRKQSQLPIGRFGHVEEIAPTALLLASKAGSFYVGQTLSPNGGDVML
ncbi:3-oxoacyl-ACP reductase family protein [Polaromonas sp. CG_23.6]|uniref:SDR family NAD(P)-dependent oxidoreductase n=1 Tax=Polaromonas sp. CG_23.6 TaxID=2760709 RepID=UPI00247496F9|nr:3-oxoacyl-ACP reductase family protein [Polaromonas sp. CG_23.6]MDH6186721.1 3-oxoacyl-[acyl-carrier protein] reductase [Polaromonas sp. CG_23.6]